MYKILILSIYLLSLITNITFIFFIKISINSYSNFKLINKLAIKLKNLVVIYKSCKNKFIIKDQYQKAIYLIRKLS